MNNLSKITVKHFLNTNLASSSDFQETDKKLRRVDTPYPLYVKITFMRKTTQMKSIVDDYFSSINEAFSKHGNLLNAEINLIENIIAKEYKSAKQAFVLKGIGDTCKKYYDINIEVLLNNYIWNDYLKIIKASRTQFMRLLLQRLPNIPSMVYYEAALKLIGKNDQLVKLKDKFEKTGMLENVRIDNKKLTDIRIIEWQYGKVKDNLRLYLLNKGNNQKLVSQLIKIIDDEIIKTGL